MARLSGNLTGRLANPAYQGMLSQGIYGGMQGISDAMAARKERHALESQMAILQNSDITDSRVQESIMAVGRQMGQNPLIGKQLIDRQLQEKRQQEAAVRAEEAAERQKEAMQMQRTMQQYRIDELEYEKAARSARAKAVNAYKNSPENLDKVLATIPAEHLEYAKEGITNARQYDAAKMTLEDKIKERTPYTEDDLAPLREMQEMELALKRYEQEKNEPGAKARLNEAYRNAYNARLYSTSKDTLKPYAVKAATQLVEDADTSWMLGFGVDNKIKQSLIIEVASRLQDGEILDTAAVRQLGKNLQVAEIAKDKAGLANAPQQEGTPPKRAQDPKTGIVYIQRPDGSWADKDGNVWQQ